MPLLILIMFLVVSGGRCKNVSEQEQQRLEAFLDAVGAAKQAKDRSSSAYSFKPVNNLNQGRFRVAAAGIIAQVGRSVWNSFSSENDAK